MTSGDDLFALALKLLADTIDRSVLIAGRDGQVRYANHRARALLGWDAPGDSAERSVDSIPLTPSLRSRLGHDSGPVEEETTIVARGQTIPVRVARHVITLDGRRAGSLVLITDLTDASSAIAERDRALRNDRAKTRSLHMVAHDMSGPLTVLNGYVSLILDGSIRLEDLEPHLPMLADQLEHMQRLVNVLLDTARLEEGRLELRLRPVDLGEFVDDMVRRMRPPETSHQLVVRREAGELPILADPVRLDSIIRNMVTNAIKYSPEGSAVTCTLRRDGGATLEVVDQGSGIEPEDLDRLFTRFGRVGDLATNPAGVGLGLFLSRELARLHGGDIEAASELGKGSRFTLRMPLRDSGDR